MSKTVVITGANRGIGLAMAQQCAERGDQVYAVCRKASSALHKLPVEIIEDIDVSDSKCLLALKLALTDISVDLLINNAGILRDDHLGQLRVDDMLAQLHINAVAPIKLTETLLDNLSLGSKVAMITSRMGSIADNGSGGYYGYRMSKAALNAGAKSLAIDLKPQGIAVGIYHPGFVQTDMVNGQGDISAATAANRLLQLMADLTLEKSGKFYHSNGDELPW